MKVAGIGLAIAQYLLQQGNNVVVLARSEKPLQELQAQHPKQARALAGDMANFDLATKAVELSNREFGQIDGLIINHGVLTPVTRVADSHPENWRQNFDVNFFSAIAFVGNSQCRPKRPRLIITRLELRFQTFVGAKVASFSHPLVRRHTRTARGELMEHQKLHSIISE